MNKKKKLLNKVFGICFVCFYLITFNIYYSIEGNCKTSSININNEVGFDKPIKENALKQIKQGLSVAGFADISDLQYLNGYRLNTDNHVVIAKYVTTFRMSMNEIKLKLQQIDTDNQKHGIFSLYSILYLGLYMKYGNANVGDSYTETTPFQFLKTENGWLLKGEYRESSNHSESNSNDSGIGLGTLMLMMD